MIRLLFLGRSNKDIAKLVGVTKEYVSKIRNSEMAKEQLDLLNGAANHNVLQLKQRIEELAPVALDVLAGVLEDNEADLKYRIKVAQDLLDRSREGAKTQHIESRNVHAVVTPDMLERIKERALEATRAATASGLVVDVTPTKESEDD